METDSRARAEWTELNTGGGPAFESWARARKSHLSRGSRFLPWYTRPLCISSTSRPSSVIAGTLLLVHEQGHIFECIGTIISYHAVDANSSGNPSQSTTAVLTIQCNDVATSFEVSRHEEFGMYCTSRTPPSLVDFKADPVFGSRTTRTP